jgi:hypothetical protein
MYRNIRRAMAAMLGLALTAALSLQASAQEDPMQVEPMDDVMDVEQSVVADYGKDCGKGCCDDGCCSGGVYAEFQYLRLDSYATEDTFEDVDEDDGYRINVGYEGCDGLGLRLRYFQFESEFDDGDEALDLEYFDIEITQSFCLCSLEGIVSAGYRHANYEEDDDDVDFNGDGITLGLQLERDITCNFGLYAWAQHSIVYGDDDSTGDEEALLGWTEVQLGAQYSSCIGGYNAFVRGGVEAQRHEGLADDDTADTGLFGWFISGGVGY